jgi:putative membrane protein
VLGDEGIHARLGTPRWESLVEKALSAARSKGVVTGVCELVVELGQTLGEHFPRAANDVNELPDAPDLG